MLFTSRITGTARDLGLSMKVARSPEQLKTLAGAQNPRCIIVDLGNPGLSIADLTQHVRKSCFPMPRIVAYGSHVDKARLDAARAAGCDEVMARSKFSADLPDLLRRLGSGIRDG